MPQSDVLIGPQPPAAHGLQVLDEAGDLVVLIEEGPAVLVQLQVARRQGVQQVDQGLLGVLVYQGLRAVHGYHGGMEQQRQMAAEVLIVLVSNLSQQAHGQLRPVQDAPGPPHQSVMQAVHDMTRSMTALAHATPDTCSCTTSALVPAMP